MFVFCGPIQSRSFCLVVFNIFSPFTEAVGFDKLTLYTGVRPLFEHKQQRKSLVWEASGTFTYLFYFSFFMKTGTLQTIQEGPRLGRSPPCIVLIFSCCQKLNRHKQQSKSLVSEDLTLLNCHMNI